MHSGGIQQQIERQQEIQQPYSENYTQPQNASFMPGIDPNNAQGTLSQNGSFMPGVVSNNTQTTLSQNGYFMSGFDHTKISHGANNIQQQKVLPENFKILKPRRRYCKCKGCKQKDCGNCNACTRKTVFSGDGSGNSLKCLAKSCLEKPIGAQRALKTYKCGGCDLVLTNKRTLKKHFDASHKVPKLQKEVPNAPFMRFESNLEILKTPKDPKLFHCEICNASYKYQQSLKTHMEKHHKTIEMPKDPKLFHCEICSVSYKYEQHLKTHMEKHKENHSKENNLQESFQPTVPVNTVSKG